MQQNIVTLGNDLEFAYLVIDVYQQVSQMNFYNEIFFTS